MHNNVHCHATKLQVSALASSLEHCEQLAIAEPLAHHCVAQRAAAQKARSTITLLQNGATARV